MTIGLPGIDRLPHIDRARAGERGITIGDFLVPIRISERLNVRVRHVALILAGTLLIALGAQVSFVLPDNVVPVTGQTFGVLVAGGALGFRRGIAAATLYVALGVVGAVRGHGHAAHAQGGDLPGQRVQALPPARPRRPAAPPQRVAQQPGQQSLPPPPQQQQRGA